MKNTTPELKIMPVIATKGEIRVLWNKLSERRVNRAIKQAIKTVNKERGIDPSTNYQTLTRSYLIEIIEILELPPGYKHFIPDYE